MITEIKKGDRFLCVKDVVMEDSGCVDYYAGKEYVSERDRCITNKHGDDSHGWTNPSQINQFFHLIVADPDTEQDLTREAIEQDEVEQVMNVYAENNDQPIASFGYEELGRGGQINWNNKEVNPATGRRYDDPNEIEWAKKWQPIKNNNMETTKEKTEKSTATFQSITASLGELLAYKNQLYGNSALEPINVFAGKSKVGQRLDDKISRVRNSVELRKNDIADMMGYLILICQENNWTNFDEFKD